jgi:hypothetical protein
LFGACSAHWLAQNPPPDLEAWGRVADPDRRLAAALAELYAYYRGNEEMFENLLRDAPSVPIVAELMGPFGGLLATATELLLRGRGARGKARDRQRAAIGHALAFETWRDLTATQGLDDPEAAALMRRLVAAA